MKCVWMAIGLVVSMCGCAAKRGEMVLRRADGSIRVRQQTVGDRAEGTYQELYASGTLKTRGSYANDVSHGLFEHFAEDGTLAAREVHFRGEITWSSREQPPEPFPAIWVARFQTEKRDPLAAPITRPTLATTDRQSPIDYALVQVGLHRVPVENLPTTVGGRLELYGQKAITGDVRGYGNLSVGAINSSSTVPSGATRPVIELGMSYAPALARTGTSRQYLGWLVRLGMFAPLSGEDADRSLITSFLAYERLGDIVTTLPHALGPRASASAFGQSERLFWRADLGLDVALDISDETDPVRLAHDVELYPRLNLAGGLDLDEATMAAELASVASVRQGGLADRHLHTLALSGAPRGWPLDPRLAILTPLDSELFARHFVAALSLSID